MVRKSYNLATQPANKGLRGRIVLIALLLALAIGSANLPAQAAPAAKGFGFRLDANVFTGGGEICIGEVLPIRVSVYREETAEDKAQQIPGVRVEASMSNAGIGKLNPISSYTGWDSDRPGVIRYKFQGQKAGKTVITFKGTIHHTWFGLAVGTFTRQDQVEVTVVECQYRVSAVSRFEVPNLSVVAEFRDVVMRLDAQGLFAGRATVHWGGQWVDQSGYCVHYLDYTTSEAALIGLMDESGQLEVNIVYTAKETPWHTACPGTPITDDRVPEPLNPSELKFEVSASGYVGKLLYQQIEYLAGKVTISVVPEKTGSGQ